MAVQLSTDDCRYLFAAQAIALGCGYSGHWKNLADYRRDMLSIILMILMSNHTEGEKVCRK